MAKTKELFWGKYTAKNIEEAKQDEDWYIRLGAYRALGWTEEAKKDKDWSIRREAELYFRIQEAKARKGAD